MNSKSRVKLDKSSSIINVDEFLRVNRKLISSYRINLVLSLCIVMHSLPVSDFTAGHWLRILDPMWMMGKLLIFTVFFISSPLWELWEYYGKANAILAPEKTAGLQQLITAFKHRGGSLSECSLLASAIIIGGILGCVLDIGRYHDASSMLPNLALTILIPLVFPVTSAGLLTIWLRLKTHILRPKPDTTVPLKALPNILHSIKVRSAQAISHFLIYKLPFASVCGAFLTGICMLSFWPLNVGGYVANWLLSSAIDANIAAARSQTFNDPTVALVSGTILALILYRAFAPLALRAAAFYQLLLQKFAQNTADGTLLEACADAIATPRSKLKVSPQHPNWRSFKESVQYITVCYAILFSLIAFCPGPLGKTITGWLDASVKDADPVVLEIGKIQHPSMPNFPGMTHQFHINWTNPTHGTYTNWVAINDDRPVRNTYILDADKIISVKHNPSAETYVPGTPIEDYNAELNREHWRTASIIGKVFLGIPPWNFSLNYHSDPMAFVASIMAACEYNQTTPGLVPTLIHYKQPEDGVHWHSIEARTYESYLVLDKAGHTYSFSQDHPDHKRLLDRIEKDPSVQKVYLLGKSHHTTQFNPYNPAGWNTAYLVGKNLSNFSHWNLPVNQHFNLRLFLASIIAAFGLVPFAIMSCAFLPLRRPDEMLISAQGILMPNKLIGAPLSFWQNLRKVSFLNTKKMDQSQHVLQLVFRPGSTIKLRLNTLPKEHLSELLAMADEYAANCQFDESVVQLRKDLATDNDLPSLADAKKFTSTIFQPYETGERIHDYSIRIVRKLASKPLSAVYLARGLDSKLVVVKQLVLPNNNDPSTEKYRQSLQREYSILSTLKHPMLARVIDAFEEGRSNNLVLEYIAGEDLRGYVTRRGPRSEKVVTAWADEICQFMQYLHSQDPAILHRDLTPDNIMLDNTGKIIIVDFGAAHQFMEGVTGTLIGKQSYIAPEQLRGKANTQSDIYSFGCTLYFLLTGKDPKALSQSDLSKTDRQISPWLNDLVKACTDFDDTRRPASFEDVQLTLRERTMGLHLDDRRDALHASTGFECQTVGRGAPCVPASEVQRTNSDRIKNLTLKENKPEAILNPTINVSKKLKEQTLYE